MISCQRPATAISVNPVLSHQIIVGCSDSTVRTFDRRMLGTQATGKNLYHNFIKVNFKTRQSRFKFKYFILFRSDR